MTPVRRRDLLVLAVAVAFATWLVVRAGYGALAGFHWWLPLPLGLLAVAEALGARTLHARLSLDRERRRAPGRSPVSAAAPVEPMLVARIAVLAQASAWVGVVIAGMWAGVLLHTVPALGRLAAAREDTVAGVIGVLVAAALALAALWLEHVCKVPPGADDEPPNGARA